MLQHKLRLWGCYESYKPVRNLYIIRLSKALGRARVMVMADGMLVSRGQRSHYLAAQLTRSKLKGSANKTRASTCARSFQCYKKQNLYADLTAFTLYCILPKMRIALLLFYFTVQDVFAQQSVQCRKILMSLTDNFFAALRKAESEGDICKMSADKLGPYQISEEYYNDAVEANQALRTGGQCH